MPPLWTDTLLAALVAAVAVRGQQEPAPALEPLVIEALRDEDWQVRLAAASLLGAFATEPDAERLHALFDDERREIRNAAWHYSLLLSPRKIERAIGCISAGNTWNDVRQLAKSLPPLVQPEHVELLTGELGRARSPHAQYALLLLLAALDAPVHDPAVAYARACEEPWQILNASALLPLLPDTPEQRERVTRWLEQDDALVRHRSAAWLLRHGATDDGIERRVIPDYVDLEVYQAEYRRAVHALGAEWTPTTRAAVLDTVGEARVVLIGDIHGSKSIADLTVDCCAASIKGGQPGKVAFGYEAPVYASFALAKPRAEALGLAAVPLEPEPQRRADLGWPWLPTLRARDATVNAAIRAWLDRSPEHKMIALYGSSHVLGAGHVEVPGAIRILTLGPALGVLRYVRTESLANGVLATDDNRWFVHRTQRETFFVICDWTWFPQTRPEFLAWLASRLRK